MALGVRAHLHHHRLGGRCKPTSPCSSTSGDAKEKSAATKRLPERPASRFLRDLPAEIRRLVYEHLWRERGPVFHIYEQDGRLYRARCVKDPIDEDPDFIQKQMDWVYSERRLGTFGEPKMCMWQRRQSGRSWGHRHWRCEERLGLGSGKYLGPTIFDTTDWLSMMLVCRQMYPEVLESIFHYHTFFINDLSAAHRFFVLRPPRMLRHVRSLDLTLSAPFREYVPFTGGSAMASSNRRLLSVLRALRELCCMHNLRISLNVCDRQFWVEVPEKGITTELRGLRVLHKFVVELPPQLPEAARTMQTQTIEEGTPFVVERRPNARYWAFQSSPFVELISWHLLGKDGDVDCWISTATTPCMRNPYITASVQ